tara:strand:- start:510 stop:1547 length:1038 start_codon:yes stop_codon:yes gene_type:complete
MRIGIVSQFDRSGYGYTALDIRKVFIGAGNAVHTLARNRENRLNDEFNCIPNVSYYTEKNIPVDIIKHWIERNDLTHCIFLGFDSSKELGDVQLIQRSLSDIKFISIPMWENVEDNKLYNFFHRIICPTKKCKEVFKSNTQAVYVKWGFDEEIFFPTTKEFEPTVKIFHPVGKWEKEDLSGKVPSLRGFLFKNRICVEEDGNLLPKSLLYVHTRLENGCNPTNTNLGNLIIGEQNLSRNEMAILYKTADVCLLPSKVEGLGLSFLEAIGTGIPIITVDDAPMNEFISNGLTGYLCNRKDLEKEIDTVIDLIQDKFILSKMKENVLKIRGEWSWKNNGNKLVEALN